MLKNFLCQEPDLDNKSILITGGTGSFGNQLVQTIIERYKPKKIIGNYSPPCCGQFNQKCS